MKTKGIIDYDLQKTLRLGIIAAIISILGIAAFAALSFFAAPFVLSVIVTALFAGSMAYLMGIGYGILNDLLAAQSNLPYFMLGHRPEQRSMIESNKVPAVGIAWGIAAVAPLALPAGVLFTITALIAGFFVPIPLFILPVMAIAIPLVVIIADVVARRKKQEMIDDKSSFAYYNWSSFQSTDEDETGLNEYQATNLKEMSNTPEEKAAWFANSDRNGIGFKYMPIIAVGALASLATFSGVSSFLPAILFGTILSTVVPAALGVVIVLAITAALIYLAVNHNKQVDNRYKLDFELETKPEPTMTFNGEYGHNNPAPDFHFKSPVFQTVLQKDNSLPSQSSRDGIKSQPGYSDRIRKTGGSPLHTIQHDSAQIEHQSIDSSKLDTASQL